MKKYEITDFDFCVDADDVEEAMNEYKEEND